jgi:hypothetical protein
MLKPETGKTGSVTVAFSAFLRPELGNEGPVNARRIPARIPTNPDIGLTSASGFW